MLGAAIGHAYQIALTHNMAPGNAGIMFYSDIVLPVRRCCWGCSGGWKERRREQQFLTFCYCCANGRRGVSQLVYPPLR